MNPSPFPRCGFCMWQLPYTVDSDDVDAMMHCWSSDSWYLQGNIAFILKHKAQANYRTKKIKSLFMCIISFYLKDFACHTDYRCAMYSNCSQYIKISSRVFLLLPRCINSRVSSAKRHAKVAGVELGFVKYMDQDFLQLQLHLPLILPLMFHMSVISQ